MPSDLQVDNIKDGSATKTLAEYASSAWSWGTPPAGTVLQYLHFETSEDNALTTSYVNYYENAITLKSASSNVIVQCSMSVFIFENAGMGIKVYRKVGSGVATSDTAVWTKNTDDGNPLTLFMDVGGGEQAYIQQITGQDVITGRSVGDVLYYGLFMRKRDGNNVNCPPNYDEDGFLTMDLIEVQK